MDWVKQNLKFVIGMVIALLLIGGAGFYAYSQYSSFTAAQNELGSARSGWESLERKAPHPGTANIDNIRSATNDLARVQSFFDRTQQLFQPLPDITITNAFQLNVAINQAIAKMSREAELFGVAIPPNYNFTFRGQKEVIDFADKSSIPKFAFHLQNIQKLTRAIYDARVHSLESIKRVRVDETDENSYGIMKNMGMTKEEFLTYTPYEISFKGFSSELANVLENLTNSKDVYIVKAMNIEPTELPVRPQEVRRTTRMIMPQPGMNPYGQSQYGSGPAMSNPYGNSGNPTPGGRNPYGGQYGGGPGGGRGQYGSAFNRQYGTTGPGSAQYGGQYGAGRAGEAANRQFSNAYGTNPASSGNPPPPGGGRPGEYGGGYSPFNPYSQMPSQPSIQTRQKEVSDKYVLSENPLLFNVLVHMVHYFDDSEKADSFISVAEENSSSEDDMYDQY